LAPAIVVRDDLEGVDWAALNDSLTADHFNNGRTPEELRRSFENSYATAIVGGGRQVVSTARILADGVCNAWLVDVWTAFSHRRQGIGSAVVGRLLERVPGHHVALFTEEAVDFYRSLGFEEELTGMSRVTGFWLNRPGFPDPPANQ
jgi:GNAT superfamily N-acetyltransferase